MRKVLQSRRRGWAVLTIASLIIGLVAINPAGAQDNPNPRWLDRNPIPEGAPFEILDVRANGRVGFSGPLARVYGEAGDGYAMIAGGDMLAVCTDETPPQQEGVMYRADGAFVVRSAPGGVQVRTYLYETDLEVFEFFDEVCGGFFENGTPIPAPLASGLATMRVFERPTVIPWNQEMQPPGRYRNSVEGTLADANGNTFEVNSFAGFRVTDDLEFVFNRLELNVTAPAA